MVKSEAQRWNEGQRLERSLHQRRKGATGAQEAREERETYRCTSKTRGTSGPKAHIRSKCTLRHKNGGCRCTHHTTACLHVHLLKTLELRLPATSTESNARATKVHSACYSSAGTPRRGSTAASGGRHTRAHPRKSPGRPQRSVIFSRSRVP